MPRHFFRKLGRRREALSQKWFMRPFRALLHDPALWSSHRRSVLRALSIGIFVGFLPLPLHMAIAAAVAVFFRVNVIIAVLTTWVSNPVTVTPIFVAAYYLGAWILGVPAGPFTIELSWDWLSQSLAAAWWPLWTGSLIMATLASGMTYLVMDAVWRISLMYRFRRRRRPRGASSSR